MHKSWQRCFLTHLRLREEVIANLRYLPTPRGTLGHRAGGPTLFDRQSPKDDSELAEKLPELFDIHVMFFADTSDTAISALQQAFALDRAAAEKLVSDVPVMVKRAASPEVADALLDLLNGLGAQVVLMPSTATPSIIPADSDAGALDANHGPGWGGLEPRAPAEAPRTMPAISRPAASLPAIAADEKDEEWRSGLTAHPPQSLPSVAPVALKVPTPVPVLSPGVESYADAFAADARSAPLELAQLEPTPRVFPAQLRQRTEAEASDAPQSGEFDLGGEAARPRPPPPPAPRTQSQKDLDLGLGSVPPLPAVAPAASAARGAGLSVPPAKPAGPPPAPVRAARKHTPADGPRVRVPSGSSFQAQLSAVADDPTGADARATDPYWSAKRRAAQGAAANAAPPGPAPAGPARSPLPGEREARPKPAEAPKESPTRRSAQLAALGVLGGVLTMVASARFEHSIFTGSANAGWALLQGAALFAIAASAARLRK